MPATFYFNFYDLYLLAITSIKMDLSKLFFPGEYDYELESCYVCV